MKKRLFVFAGAFCYSLSIALLSYLNSTFLTRVYSEATTSFLYISGSILAIFFASRVGLLIKKIGVVQTGYIGFSLSIVCLLLLSTLLGGIGLAVAFIGYFSLLCIGYSILDILLEHYSPKNAIGSTRGIYLVCTSAAWLIAAFGNTILLQLISLRTIYLFAALLTGLTMFFLSHCTKAMPQLQRKNFHVRHVIQMIVTKSKFRHLFVFNLLLQIFYTTMVIYSPLYLSQFLPLRSIAAIFAIMLIPFVVLQYPYGKLCDRLHIEKSGVTYGFILMAVGAVTFVSLPWHMGAIVFAIVLFISRIGAAIAEISIESAFFKRVGDDDPSAVSMFRSLSSISYVLVPLYVIFFTPTYTTLFLLLAVILSGVSAFLATSPDHTISL